MARKTTPAVYNVADAKAHLPALIERAHTGETIVLSRAGKPRAMLVPLAPPRASKRVPGKGKGRFVVARGFDDPLPAAVVGLFEGRKP